MNEIDLYDAEESDIAAIQAFAAQVYPLHFPPEQAQRLLQRLYNEEALRRSIANENTVMLVAYRHGQLVGLCAYGGSLAGSCEDIIEIHRLFIHPAHYRTGIASEFIAEIEADMDADACLALMTVYINPADEARLRFFAKLGFHHEMSEDVDGMWYMEKAL